MKQHRELAGVEVLRFICAFAILIWHYQHFLVSGVTDETVLAQIRSTLPMYALLLPAYKYGYWAVNVFWLISGFIFYRQYAEVVSDLSVGFSDFAIRRVSRLYPLHLVTLLLVAVGQVIYGSSHENAFIYQNNNAASFISQLFFASSWFSWQTTSFNGPIWSISAEILVYVLFFGIVRIFGPSAIVAFFAWGISWILSERGFADSFLNSNILSCATFFFAGATVQRLCKHPQAIWLAGCVGLVTLVLLMLHVCHVNTESMLALAASAVVFFSCLEESSAISVMRRVSFLGNATYSSYLIHFPLQLAIVILIDKLHFSRSVFLHPVALLGFLAFVTANALAVYHWFEKPAQDWIRNRWNYLVRKGRTS